jgi:hypothetical protein
VNFELEFDVAAAEETEVEAEITAYPVQPTETAAAEPAGENGEAKPGASVVSLDAFRKKN